eukprot:TRINITY_DN12892_c0_g1_i1.p1 TRINITY_DN12892_c0_g1~~TRINITY_DN12892_c0_g1_i1.p1  ORF type:complete len:246 (+),score=84.65 TRINITY_DN12892_c0_g1_i1:53-790(+)
MPLLPFILKPSVHKQLNGHRKFYEVDATGKVVGRLANQISKILQGKHKPTLVPGGDTGDCVVVKNVEKAVFTGKKWDYKTYVSHSGWSSGRKEIKASVYLANYPERVLHHAVKGMLPKNKLRGDRLKRLTLLPTGTPNPYEEEVKSTLHPHHILDAFDKTTWRPLEFDPAIYKGKHTQTKVLSDGTVEETQIIGEGKRRFREQKLKKAKTEKPFRERVVEKPKPLPTIFDLLPKEIFTEKKGGKK